MRKTAFTLLATTLAMSTGCTLAGGALVGNQLFGDQDIGIGMSEPGMAGFTGTSLVCLGSDAELSDEEISEGLYEINGRVNGTYNASDIGFDDNVVPCWTQPEVVFEIEDVDGNTWQVGYAWMDGSGWDMTPWVSAREGSRVDVTVRHEVGTEAAGFVVSRNDELLYVLESGRGARGFRSDDVPGLAVNRHDDLGTIDTDCGSASRFAIELESDDDRLVLYPGEDTGFETGGESLTVCSIEAIEYEDDCNTGELSYVMFK
jgi:hypothetical protein